MTIPKEALKLLISYIMIYIFIYFLVLLIVIEVSELKRKIHEEKQANQKNNNRNTGKEDMFDNLIVMVVLTYRHTIVLARKTCLTTLFSW